MRYACRSFPKDISSQDLERTLNDAAMHGWTCEGILTRASELLIVFGGEFANIGDLEIATSMLDGDL
ncbi:MAG: hypothetical protein ACXWNH_19400 [Vulcanimicrobiaceae bacterium]